MPNKGFSKISKINNKDLELLYNKQISFKEFCTKYHVSDSTMRIFFKENNLELISSRKSNTIQHDYFNKINTAEKAYIFGIYIADGYISISKSSSRFGISLNVNDIELLTKIRDILSPLSKLYFEKARINAQGIKSNPMYKLIISSKTICDKLNQYNCGKNKTNLLKSIKNIIPKEYMFDFIRGYFDGDGCITTNSVRKRYLTKDGTSKIYNYTNVSFSITSKDWLILEEVKEFLSAHISKINLYQESRGNWLLTVNRKSEVKKLYSLLYYNNSLLCLNRKYQKFKQIMETSC